MSFSKYEDFLKYLETEPIRNLPGAESVKRWSSNLAEDLGGDFDVFTPIMPNKQNAKYLEWKIWFERHFEFLRDDTTLLGWSQGGYFLSKYLTENQPPFKIKTLILVAAPFELGDFGGEDVGDFAFDTRKVRELQNKAQNIVIMHSKDDFVVPYEHVLKYLEALPEAELISFEDKNHFLIPEFPELIEKIRSF